MKFNGFCRVLVKDDIGKKDGCGTRYLKDKTVGLSK